GRLIAGLNDLPRNWEHVVADVMHFWGWTPDVTWGQTWSETLRHLAEANRITRQRAAKP
ncbi:MAG: hypothetical protein JWP25_1004, partial [Bradyrhizobium sp.]|nr:hypothetical protein [Bradyrhizobium sp.]